MRPIVIALAMALALGLAACGGGGGTTTGAAATGAGQAQNPGSGNGKSGSSAATSTARGDTSIQDFGRAAGGGDASSAGAAVHGYLAARAAGQYARACSYLSTAFQQQLGELGGPAAQGKGADCATVLARMSAPLPPQVRHDLGVVRVTSVRVNGDRAFVLYRGAHGVKSFMPVSKQGNSWKVAALAGSNLP